MSINPLKEFFKRKKTEAKFAKAGPGHKLSQTASNQPSSSKDQTPAQKAAADAALKRFSKDNTKPAQRPRITQTSDDSKSQTEKTTEPRPGSSEEARRQNELQVIDGVTQRDVRVYSTAELAQQTKQPEIDDDFFRLTVEDAKLFKQRYDEERARNEILKTSEMRKREAEAKKPTTNVARIRFKLPNDLVLEASFAANESLGVVRDWLVKTSVEKAELRMKDFDILFGLRPFKNTDFDKNIRELGLLPATTLTVVQKTS